MGISENVFITRKALKLIDELTSCIFEINDENNLTLMTLAEIRGVVELANELRKDRMDEQEKV